MERNLKVKRCASIKEYIRDIIIDSVVGEESPLPSTDIPPPEP